MRLVVIVISSFGAIGPEGHAFLTELGHRTGQTVPYALLDVATWAAPRFTPFMRMALTCVARRALAESIFRWWRRVPRAPSPPPPPQPRALLPPILPPAGLPPLLLLGAPPLAGDAIVPIIAPMPMHATLHDPELAPGADAHAAVAGHLWGQ